MTGIKEERAKYRIKDLVGQKVTAIKFSEEPEVDDCLTQVQTENCLASCKTEYILQTGQIFIELENGVVLSIWFPDAGGMVVSTREEVGIPDDQYDDRFDFMEVEDA